jgi:glycosyltransferase involved in cell wall biosynthesis
VRILLDYRPALRQRTGVGAYIHETALALVATAPDGESLVLFSSSWKDRLAADVVPGAGTVDRHIPVRLLNYLWHRLEWPPIEQVAGGRFDVAHSGHPLLMPSAAAAQVVTIYDLDFLDHPERTAGEIRRDYGALVASHARRADQIVVISHDTAQQVETRLGVPPDRISLCVPGAPAWTARASEPRTNGCILFLGTLEPRKNLDTLLDAYARLIARQPDAPRLVLAGRIAPEASSLAARAGDAVFGGRIDLPGYVDDAAKRALFDRALVFVLPSHAEGFGLPAVEAMAAGVPVIAARRGALPEVLGSAARLIEPDDPDLLAAVIAELLGDPEQRRRMTEAGLARAHEFSWTNTARSLREAWRRARDHHEVRRRA